MRKKIIILDEDRESLNTLSEILTKTALFEVEMCLERKAVIEKLEKDPSIEVILSTQNISSRAEDDEEEISRAIKKLKHSAQLFTIGSFNLTEVLISKNKILLISKDELLNSMM